MAGVGLELSKRVILGSRQRLIDAASSFVTLELQVEQLSSSTQVGTCLLCAA
jgi:hypothetical protein